MVSVNHALGLIFISRLFAGFLVSQEPASEEASFWDDGIADQIDAVCSVSSEHLLLLQPLQQ